MLMQAPGSPFFRGAANGLGLPWGDALKQGWEYGQQGEVCVPAFSTDNPHRSHKLTSSLDMRTQAQVSHSCLARPLLYSH